MLIVNSIFKMKKVEVPKLLVILKADVDCMKFLLNSPEPYIYPN